MTTEIRILMVDDHSLFRESLARLLQSTPQMRVVGQCSTIAEAMERLPRIQPQVVLLDYDLGEETGFALLQRLKEQASSTRVLMVTAGMSDELTLRTVEAGASGVFLKHDSAERLLIAIRKVAAGEIWLDPAALDALVSGTRNRSEGANRTQPLTARQAEVLRGILDGLANKEIASRLNTSETSVKAVIQELFRKAGVRTRSQLVRIAFEKHSSDWLSRSPDR